MSQAVHNDHLEAFRSRGPDGKGIGHQLTGLAGALRLASGCVHPLNADLHCHLVVSRRHPDASGVNWLLARPPAGGGVVSRPTTAKSAVGQQRAGRPPPGCQRHPLPGGDRNLSVTLCRRNEGATSWAWSFRPTSKPRHCARAWAPPQVAAVAHARWNVGPTGRARVGIRMRTGRTRQCGQPRALVSRKHFARAFSWKPAFGQARPRSSANAPDRRQAGLLAHRWRRYRQRGAVDLAGGRHGQAIAHPARYRFTANEEYALFTRIPGPRRTRAVMGVVTGSHTAAEAPQITPGPRANSVSAASRVATSTARHEVRTDPGKPAPAGRAHPGVGVAGGPHPANARRGHRGAGRHCAGHCRRGLALPPRDTTTSTHQPGRCRCSWRCGFRCLFRAVATAAAARSATRLSVLRTAHPQIPVPARRICR